MRSNKLYFLIYDENHSSTLSGQEATSFYHSYNISNSDDIQSDGSVRPVRAMNIKTSAETYQESFLGEVSLNYEMVPGAQEIFMNSSTLDPLEFEFEVGFSELISNSHLYTLMSYVHSNHYSRIYFLTESDAEAAFALSSQSTGDSDVTRGDDQVKLFLQRFPYYRAVLKQSPVIDYIGSEYDNEMFATVNLSFLCSSYSPLISTEFEPDLINYIDSANKNLAIVGLQNTGIAIAPLGFIINRNAPVTLGSGVRVKITNTQNKTYMEFDLPPSGVLEFDDRTGRFFIPVSHSSDGTEIDNGDFNPYTNLEGSDAVDLEPNGSSIHGSVILINEIQIEVEDLTESPQPLELYSLSVSYVSNVFS